MKKPTIKDVAASAGVSPACVSMILTGKNLQRFSKQTIQNVYQATRELGYLPKKNRSKSVKNTILIICPSLMNPYYTTLIQSMEQEARVRGFLTLVFTTYWSKNAERDILELSARSTVAGVIFAMIPQQPHLAEEISKMVPMVTVGDRAYSVNIDTVDVNNYAAGRMIAAHLIGLGHNHIAYVSTTLNSEHSSRISRYSGMKEEYAETCPDGSISVFSQDISPNRELYTIAVEHEIGYEMTKKCLKEKPEVTAIVAVNDMVAYGARQALLEAGKRIPEDISLCGFDNIFPSRFEGIDLTTVEHAIVGRGRSSVRLLAEKIQTREDTSHGKAITRMEYQGELVVGSTTGQAPADGAFSYPGNGQTQSGTDRS